MISAEEARLYDRQIRLWGIDAQQKIRLADVLVIGLNGLATEVVKNLVLTGINSITMSDDQPVTPFDMLTNLFSNQQIGKNRAEACQKAVLQLNPMVKVNIKTEPLKTLLNNEDEAKKFLQKFHVVILVNHGLEIATRLNEICNQLKVPFIFANAFGDLSMVFLDLCENITDMKFVSLKEALKKMKLTLKNDNRLTNRNMAKLSNYQKILSAMLTIFKYHHKNGKFPLFHEESDDPVTLKQELMVIEKEVLNELNAKRTADKELQKQPEWTSLEKDWHKNINGQFSFTESIVGGFLAQEVIRTVTKTNIDYNLFLYYNGDGHNINIGQ